MLLFDDSTKKSFKNHELAEVKNFHIAKTALFLWVGLAAGGGDDLLW